MSDGSKIEWTEATWNPVTGCTKVSPGCDNCYAETFAERWRGIPGHHFENGFDVTLRPERLDQPLRWRKSRRIFVNSMSDLFHDAVPDEFIARVFAVMALAPQHTFQLLTKRHGRMRSLLNRPEFLAQVEEAIRGVVAAYSTPQVWYSAWPLPNVWLGVSVEEQKWAETRIPALLATPAAVRWLSCEPLLGPIDLKQAGGLLVDWVVVGGESGPKARPMHPDWARSLRDQCADAEVPFFFKQWGAWCPPHPDQGQSIFGHVTNEDACQVVDRAGRLRGRPWSGWKIQDGTRDAEVMRRYPKKLAGRVLDGRAWDQYPGGSDD